MSGPACRRFLAVVVASALIGGVLSSVASAAPPAGVSMQGTGKPPKGLGLFSSAALAQEDSADNGRMWLTYEGSGAWCVTPWMAGEDNSGCATAPGVDCN